MAANAKDQPYWQLKQASLVLVLFNISSLILEMYNTRPTTRDRPSRARGGMEKKKCVCVGGSSCHGVITDTGPQFPVTTQQGRHSMVMPVTIVHANHYQMKNQRMCPGDLKLNHIEPVSLTQIKPSPEQRSTFNDDSSIHSSLILQRTLKCSYIHRIYIYTHKAAHYGFVTP